MAVAIIDTRKLGAEIASLGFTQQSFADYARMKGADLSRILTGGAASPEVLHRIARALADAKRGKK